MAGIPNLTERVNIFGILGDCGGGCLHRMTAWKTGLTTKWLSWGDSCKPGAATLECVLPADPKVYFLYSSALIK